MHIYITHTHALGVILRVSLPSGPVTAELPHSSTYCSSKLNVYLCIYFLIIIYSLLF